MFRAVIQHDESDRLLSIRKLQGLTKQWLIWEWESQMSFLAAAQQHCVNAKGQRFNLFCAVQILKACHIGFSSAEGRRWEHTSYEPENAAKEMNSLTCSQALRWARKYYQHQHQMFLHICSDVRGKHYSLFFVVTVNLPCTFICIVIICTGLEASMTTASCDVTNPPAMRPCVEVRFEKKRSSFRRWMWEQPSRVNCTYIRVKLKHSQ